MFDSLANGMSGMDNNGGVKRPDRLNEWEGLEGKDGRAGRE